MKKFQVALCIWILAAAAGRVEARLGETEEQIAIRYGKPVKTLASTKPVTAARFYRKSGYLILVRFMDGKSCYESFKKEPKNDFSAVEIDTLLKANAGTSSWKMRSPDPVNPSWERMDGDALARYGTAEKRLSIENRAHSEGMEAEKNQRQKKQLEDF
ncbi:MAG: hypothetical protein HY360_15560 [Verrucomicrobia bacterium]|nr:hypothetical protein [Verrucomicrobiota bacterium]